LAASQDVKSGQWLIAQTRFVRWQGARARTAKKKRAGSPGKPVVIPHPPGLSGGDHHRQAV